MKNDNFQKGEILIYKTPQNEMELKVRFKNESVWLRQNEITLLFSKERSVITKHIIKIFTDKEVDKKSNVQKIHIPNSDKPVAFYSLDVIISVGYRVKSKQGTQFRIWANQILKDHLIKGYTLNPKRLPESNLKELEEAIELIKGTLKTKELTSDESIGLLKVITDYANSWILLQKYDSNKLEEPKKKHKPKYILNYEKSIEAIAKLKADLKPKKEASDLFGNQRDKSFEGIIGNLYQTFDREELYPAIEDKAAHLLYFIIKDHPFTDGNKRIGSFLFILYLASNGYLFKSNGERKINDNTLVALALLIAESNPKQKDTMIKLVMNFLNN